MAIKRRGDWFYYYKHSFSGKINIITLEFIGATSCMNELLNHINMIKEDIKLLLKAYKANNDYIGICSKMRIFSFSKASKAFIVSKLPKTYYTSSGTQIDEPIDKKNLYRFPDQKSRVEFLENLSKIYCS